MHVRKRVCAPAAKIEFTVYDTTAVGIVDGVDVGVNQIGSEDDPFPLGIDGIWLKAAVGHGHLRRCKA